MVLSFVFLFLFVLSSSLLLFFFFAFFVPALSLRYDSVDELFSVEEFVDGEDALIEKKNRAEPHAGRFARIDAVASPLDFSWTGEKNCALFHSIYGTPVGSDGFTSCIGFGDCARACPQKAIVVRDGVATVTESCDGCALCIGSCPINLVSLVPEMPQTENKLFRFWDSCYKIISG